eukprot:TRINITY_DN13677_c0_g1_i1.p1 TRINITY_DN13677_c0_g1~~TRINITY_DN13677_c0_g1_i1.p1  ORF type:complete len:208 (-),score=14.55 TRINITY_DN13677_c0_g1_i1:85-708(-)
MPKLKSFIDANKGTIIFVGFLLVYYYDRWENVTALIYVALHGSYGILWIIKSWLFPDSSWEVNVSWFYGIFVAWGSLSLYWAPMFIICKYNIQAPNLVLFYVISQYTFGIFFHFVSDMQKYTSLKLKKGLITDGLWSLSRNINYFGELLIYLSFSMLSLHWFPFVINLLFFIFYWLPNMKRKEESLQKYKEFEIWAKKTKFFIPFVY